MSVIQASVAGVIEEPEIVRGARGSITVKVETVVYEPCPIHGPLHELCDCLKVEVPGSRECKEDITLAAFAQMAMALIFASTQTIPDTTNTGRSVAAGSTSSAPTICAGTDGTAATFSEYALNAQTETAAGTITALSSNSFSITANVVAGADRLYEEIGVRVTNGGNTFMLTRDVISKNVSNGGILATTIIITWN